MNILGFALGFGQKRAVPEENDDNNQDKGNKKRRAVDEGRDASQAKPQDALKDRPQAGREDQTKRSKNVRGEMVPSGVGGPVPPQNAAPGRRGNNPLPASFFQAIDIDRDGIPTFCPAYADQIFQHYRIVEFSILASTVGSVGAEQRDREHSKMMSELLRLADYNTFLPETSHLAAAFFDLFNTRKKMDTSLEELLSTGCLFVASKYEEVRPGLAQDFAAVTTQTYRTKDVVTMEAIILSALDYDLNIPTSFRFLRRFMLASHATQPQDKELSLRMEYLSCYLSEITIVGYNSFRFLPSLVASSLIFLSRVTLNLYPWNLTLQHYTGYKPSNLKECVTAIQFLQLNAPSFNAFNVITTKYNKPKYRGVPTLKSQVPLPEHLFRDE